MAAKIIKSHINTDDVGKTWPQIFAILIGSLCGLSDGIFLSWSSPFIVQITQDKENYDISTEEASYFTTIPWIGFIIGCPVFAFLADKIGRKRTYFFTALLHLLAYLFAAFASDIYLFYTSRICFGLASSCYYAVFPIYIGEISKPEVRGRWGNAVASSIYLGGLLVNILGSYLNVSWTSYVCIPLPLLFLLLFNAMPESPYYLVMKGYEDEAKQALRFFTRKTDVDNDYFVLKTDVERQLSESGTFQDLFTIDSNRRALIAGVFLRVSQLSSGLMIVFMFTQSIFQISGSEIDHGLLSIILMAANFGLNLLVLVFIVHRFSRKKLFVISSSHAGIVMFLLGTYFYLVENTDIDLSLFGWVPPASLVLFLVFASFGLSVMPTLMMSELFSASIKAKAILVLLIITAITNLFINSTFYYLVANLGLNFALYIYAACSIISAFMSLYIIPETNGKTLEEIQQLLKRKNI